MKTFVAIKTRLFYSVIFKIVPRNWKFKMIHFFNLWDSGESISGPGSEISKTKDLVEFLDNFLHSYNIKSMLDVPCGDFNWMKLVKLDGIQYTGGDIVPELITSNKKKYEKENIKFTVLDLVNQELPATDLVLVRDLFIHFSHDITKKALANIKKSKSRYLLTTTFPETTTNISIRDGYNYDINLLLPPFNLAVPILFFEEKELSVKQSRKGLGLWKIDQIEIS